MRTVLLKGKRFTIILNRILSLVYPTLSNVYNKYKLCTAFVRRNESIYTLRIALCLFIRYFKEITFEEKAYNAKRNIHKILFQKEIQK